ncbi:hypothetical protein Scep_025972 [Stephania cephalantha]|uniref:Membrane-associated kinase regulator 6 n=1 Tax=Stephania cephalantha TaxID=152367 RepID=A0AAP0EPU6_9MAGN
MEAASQPFSIESFSYSWVINIKPSIEGLDENLVVRSSLEFSKEEAHTFIELDPKLTASKRFTTKKYPQDFNFDLPLFPHQSSPLALVHADELFSNGLLMPFFLKQSKLDSLNSTSHSVPNSPSCLSSKSSSFLFSTGRLRYPCPFITRCRRSSKQILLKYLSFFRPLYRRVQRHQQQQQQQQPSRLSNSISSRAKRNADFGHSSPQITKACSNNGDWCYIDNSISEAILHCKRSIGT